MKKKNNNLIAVLPGDGVGQEVVSAAVNVIKYVTSKAHLCFDFKFADIGTSAYEKTGQYFPEATKSICDDANAIIFGAVEKEPLLEIRERYHFFANIRPVLGNGLDLRIFRELTGGIYFGESGTKLVNGKIKGYHTEEYSEDEIARIVHMAFRYARNNRKTLVSIDKDNAMPKLKWRDIVNGICRKYPDVKCTHMYIDNAVAQLYRNPKSFEVIVASNMFGDIISDLAAEMAGSIGLAPSASINEDDIGMFEPIHGTAPDIAGKGIANPIGAISSAAMMLEHLGFKKLSERIDLAIQETLEKYRTPDLLNHKGEVLGTKEFTKKIIENIIV